MYCPMKEPKLIYKNVYVLSNERTGRHILLLKTCMYCPTPMKKWDVLYKYIKIVHLLSFERTRRPDIII